jgi:hypothetical protein
MLLEIDNTELLHMLKSLESLKAKVCLLWKKKKLLKIYFDIRLKKLLLYFKLTKLNYFMLLNKPQKVQRKIKDNFSSMTSLQTKQTYWYTHCLLFFKFTLCAVNIILINRLKYSLEWVLSVFETVMISSGRSLSSNEKTPQFFRSHTAITPCLSKQIMMTLAMMQKSR